MQLKKVSDFRIGVLKQFGATWRVTVPDFLSPKSIQTCWTLDIRHWISNQLDILVNRYRYRYTVHPWSPCPTFRQSFLSLVLGPVLLLVHLRGVGHHPVQPVVLCGPALRHLQHGYKRGAIQPTTHIPPWRSIHININKRAVVLHSWVASISKSKP